MKSEQVKSEEKHYQVFLTYASADRQVAQSIVDRLRQQGISVWFDIYELQQGDSIARTIEKAISASDYLVVLLSPQSVDSVWVQKELGAALSSDLAARDITLLPVLISDSEVPSTLANYQYLDLSTDFERGLDRLVEQISAAPEIDFSKLDWRAFEALIADLLVELGFRNVEQKLAVSDSGVDIRAHYSHIDPFGIEVTDTWLVEIRFYRQGRADLKSIHQLGGYISGLPARSKGLLVTNGQLTSAAREWLKSAEANSRVEIRMIDGTELKRLLLQHSHLIRKYFAGKSGQ
jgi:hypothetical protein